MKRLRTATLAAALLLGSIASTASATIITPSTTADDTNNGNCTLREAVQAANAGKTVDQCPAGTAGTNVIHLGAGTYDLTIPGAHREEVRDLLVRNLLRATRDGRNVEP